MKANSNFMFGEEFFFSQALFFIFIKKKKKSSIIFLFFFHRIKSGIADRFDRSQTSIDTGITIEKEILMKHIKKVQHPPYTKYTIDPTITTINPIIKATGIITEMIGIIIAMKISTSHIDNKENTDCMTRTTTILMEDRQILRFYPPRKIKNFCREVFYSVNRNEFM